MIEVELQSLGQAMYNYIGNLDIFFFWFFRPRVAVRGGPFLCAAKKFRVTCIRFTL